MVPIVHTESGKFVSMFFRKRCEYDEGNVENGWGSNTATCE